MANVTAPQFQQDVNNAADWANGDENTTVTMRLGQQADSPAKVIKRVDDLAEAAILELNKSRGFRVVGKFADGFSYELYNDVGIDDDGNSWIYVGAGAPIKSVPPGETPSNPDYIQVTFVRDVDFLTWGNRFRGSFASGFTYSHSSDVALGQDNNYYRYIGVSAYPVNITAGTEPYNDTANFKKVTSSDGLTLDDYNQLKSFSNLALTSNLRVKISKRVVDGDFGGGEFKWRSGDYSTQVSNDTLEGIYVAPNFDPTGSSGVFIRVRKSKKIYSSWFGLITDSLDEQSAIFNAMCASLSDGDLLIVNKGSYVISGGEVDTKNNLTIKAEGEVLISHPIEGDTGRTITKKNILFSDSVGCKIKGFKLKGQHTNNLLGDNAWQSGIVFENCEDCDAVRCEAEDLQRCFIASGSTNIRAIHCKGKTAYNAFLATNGSSDIKWIHSVAEDTYFGKQFDGGAPTTLATGYGFLADSSSDCLGQNCKSIRSGSDCFRSSAGTASRNKWINCESYSARRNAFSHREPTGFDNQTINCDAYDVGDINFWTGAANSYTEPATNARAHYLDSIAARVFGGKIRNGLLSTESNMNEMIYVNQAGARVESVEAVGYVTGNGVNITSNATTCNLIDNEIEIQILSAPEGIYGVTASGNSHQIINNKVKGGQDNYLVLADNTDIKGNRGEFAGRHCIYAANEDGYVDSNTSVNCGQTSVGAAVYVADANVTLGTNIAVDRQGAPTMDYVLWLAASATGCVVGQMIPRSSVTAVRDDVGVGTRLGDFKGKGEAATDITTLLTSLRSAEIIDS